MFAFPKSSAFYHTFVYLQNRDAPDNFIQPTSDAREIKRVVVVKSGLSELSYRQIIKQLNVSLNFIYQ